MASNMYMVHTIFRLTDKMSQPLKKMTANTSKIQKSFAGQLNQISAAFQSVSSFSQEVASKAVLATVAIGGMGAMALKQSALVESAITSMTGKLGGARHEAIDLVKGLEKFAINNPLTINPVLQGANNLMAQGVQESDLMKTLGQLGDLASGNDEAFESMVRGYGRIYAENRITREHLDRFITHNVGIYEALAKAMNMNQGQLDREMQAGRIGRDALLKAVEQMTGESGIYHRSMEKHMNTLGGATQRFKGMGSLVMRGIGDTGNIFARLAMNSGSDYLDGISQVFDKINEKVFTYEVGTGENKEWATGRTVSSIQEAMDFFPNMSEADGIFKNMGDAARALGQNSNKDENNQVIQVSTKAFNNIWDALNRIKAAFEGLLPNWDDVYARLEDGSSFFFTFCDAIVAMINGLKTAKWWVNLFMDEIANLPKPIKWLAFELFPKIIGFGLVAAPVFAGFFGIAGSLLTTFGLIKLIVPKILFNIQFVFLKFGMEILPKMSGALSKTFPALATKLTKLSSVLVNTVGNTTSGFVGRVFKTITAPLRTLGAKIATPFKALGTKIAPLLKPLGAKIGIALKPIMATIVKIIALPFVKIILIVAAVVAAFALLVKGFSLLYEKCTWFRNAVDWLMNALDRGIKRLKELNNPIANWLASLLMGIKRIFQSFIDGDILRALASIGNCILKILFGVVELLISGLQALVRKIPGIGEDAANGMESWKDGLNGVTKSIGDWIDKNHKTEEQVEAEEQEDVKREGSLSKLFGGGGVNSTNTGSELAAQGAGNAVMKGTHAPIKIYNTSNVKTKIESDDGILEEEVDVDVDVEGVPNNSFGYPLNYAMG